MPPTTLCSAKTFVDGKTRCLSPWKHCDYKLSDGMEVTFPEYKFGQIIEQNTGGQMAEIARQEDMIDVSKKHWVVAKIDERRLEPILKAIGSESEAIKMATELVTERGGSVLILEATTIVRAKAGVENLKPAK